MKQLPSNNPNSHLPLAPKRTNTPVVRPLGKRENVVVRHILPHMQLQRDDQRPSRLAHSRRGQLPYVRRGQMQHLGMPLDLPHDAQKRFHAPRGGTARRRRLQEHCPEYERSAVRYVEGDDGDERGDDEITGSVLRAVIRLVDKKT